MGQQQVVHLPELAVGGGGLGSLRRKLRVRVDVVERQVTPHVAQIAEIGQQLAHHLLRLPAVGALEVAVLDQRDRRVVRSADVVALDVDGDGQVDDRLVCAEQARSLPLRGQQRGAPAPRPRSERRRRAPR